MTVQGRLMQVCFIETHQVLGEKKRLATFLTDHMKLQNNTSHVIF